MPIVVKYSIYCCYRVQRCFNPPLLHGGLFWTKEVQLLETKKIYSILIFKVQKLTNFYFHIILSPIFSMHCKPSLQNSCHQKVSEKKSSRNIEPRFGNDAEGHYYWSQKWPPIFFIFNFAQYSVPRIPSRHSYFYQMSKLCQRKATRFLQNVTTAAEPLYTHTELSTV